MDVVVTYDISIDKGGANRQRRVADICHSYGYRAQQSVFECRISPTRFARMVGELEDVIDPSLDSISLYVLRGDLEKCRTTLGIRISSRQVGDPWFA